MTPDLPDLTPWVIDAPLGGGGQGFTYRAHHQETQQVAALKIFKVNLAEDWKRLELFEREVAVLRHLDHPQIPKLLDAGSSSDGATRWLAMELIAGRPLSDRLGTPGAFSAAELRSIFRQILDLLAWLHARVPPVIHRDLKPDNIVIDAAGQAHLVDFGSVRAALRADGGSTVSGTFGYLAPEQLHGQATPATDLFGLGMTMLALASGQPGHALPRRGLKIDVTELLHDFPDRALLATWLTLVEPDPDLRPQSAAEVLAYMSAPVAPSRSVTSTSPASPLPPRLLDDLPRNRLGRIIALVILIATSLALFGVTFWTQRVLPRIERRKQRHLELASAADPERDQQRRERLERRATAERAALATADRTLRTLREEARSHTSRSRNNTRSNKYDKLRDR